MQNLIVSVSSSDTLNLYGGGAVILGGISALLFIVALFGKRPRTLRQKLPEQNRVIGPAASAPSNVASAPSVAPTVSPAPTLAPTAVAAAPPGAPEVRKAKPVTRADLARPQEPTNSAPAESGEQNRVAIRPLKRTYVRVTVGDEKGRPAFERWVSPADGPVEFRGKHVSIRVLDPGAVTITKNGKALEAGDQDGTVN